MESIIRHFLFVLNVFPLEVVTLYDLDPVLDRTVGVISSFGSQTLSPELSGINLGDELIPLNSGDDKDKTVDVIVYARPVYG